MSIVGERINSGIYHIENFVSKNFVNVEGFSPVLVCRPGNKGQWQIIPDGPGYSISLLRENTASEYPSVLSQPDDKGRYPVVASRFSATWRIVKDPQHQDYFRIFWRDTDWVWDLADYGKGDVIHYKENSPDPNQPCRLWKLIPIPIILPA